MNEVAYFLVTFFFGWFGLHRFLTKRIFSGFVYLCTFGLFGIGWIIDVAIAANNYLKKEKELNKIAKETVDRFHVFYSDEEKHYFKQNEIKNFSSEQIRRIVESSPYMQLDELFESAGKYVIESKKPLIAMLQRKFKIGFTRASSIIDQLENYHVISPEIGTKGREVIMSNYDFVILCKTIKSLNYDYDFIQTEINKSESIADFDNLTGEQFELFCADIITKNGFYNVTTTKASGDHGIDILAEKDDITYAIQCKCYSSNVGNSAIQQAHTGKTLYHKDVAVVMTNQYFTKQAKEEAEQLSVKLWDRDKINSLLNNK